MEPLIVTAHLRNGFASSDVWSPSLDGILAYWLLREQLGEEEFALGMSDPSRLRTPADLPLERVERAGEWWWACSAPIVDAAMVYQKYFHRRFDLHHAIAFGDDAMKRVRTTAGPYKAYRLTNLVRVTRRVQWHCIGDPDAIRHLLRRCDAIGAKTAHGLGRVEQWTVEPGGDPDRARHDRPLPVAYAEAVGIDGPVLFWGIRPPGRLPENKCLCVMPRRGEVIVRAPTA